MIRTQLRFHGFPGRFSVFFQISNIPSKRQCPPWLYMYREGGQASTEYNVPDLGRPLRPVVEGGDEGPGG